MLSHHQKLKFKKLSFKKPFDTSNSEAIHKGDIVKIYERLTGNKTRRFGTVIQGLCPFHDERTPSFAMYPETSSANCFACGWNGDSIKMVIELSKVEFKEALEIIKSI